MGKEYISKQQGLLLVAGFTIGTALLLVPTAAITKAMQDAWLSPLPALLPGIGLIGILVALNKMYPGQSLVQYSESILGLPGKLVSLLVVWFAFHLATLVLRNMGNFVSVVLLFETPCPLVHVITAVLVAFGVRLGIESIARAMCIFIPIVLVVFVIVQFITLENVNLAQLVPVLGHGILPVINAGVGITSFPVGEIILFSMIIHHIKDNKKIGYYLVTGLMLGVLAISLGILRVLTALGPYVGSRTSFSPLVAITATGVSDLLEPFVAINWFIFIVCKLFVCYYAFVLGFAQWAKLPDYKPLVLPAGALITAFSLYVYMNTFQETTFASQIWPVYAIPIEYGIPLLLLVVALIRGKAGGRS